jgi:hypothetical protein
MTTDRTTDPFARRELPTAARRSMTDNHITGTILAVRECVSLVLVYLSTDDGRTVPIPVDHRTFGWLLEAEGCRPDQLVGRRISYDGDRIRFLDGE